MTAMAFQEIVGFATDRFDAEADDSDTAAGNTVGSEVAGWVREAAAGDLQAWNRLVDQYARLIWSITTRFKLSESDAADVVQTTWMRLIEHIHRIEQPARVGSWLATTARNECLRHVTAHKKIVLVHEDGEFDGADNCEPDLDEALLADERAQDVRQAMAHLPPQWQRLMELLTADPPVSYVEISDQLGVPIGSIGPTRGRCLARLRVLLEAS
jgi:RNA polymerase sigma factor (sigma-70 family)